MHHGTKRPSLARGVTCHLISIRSSIIPADPDTIIPIKQIVLICRGVSVRDAIYTHTHVRWNVPRVCGAHTHGHRVRAYICTYIYPPVTLHEGWCGPTPIANQPCHNAIWVNCGGDEGGGGGREWDRCSRASSSINCKHTIRNVLRAARLDRCPCGRGGGWSCGVVLTIPWRVETRACVGVCVKRSLPCAGNNFSILLSREFFCQIP